MVVDLDDIDAVRSYVSEHAARGLAHVRALIEADRDVMAGLLSDVTQAESDIRITDEEYSISMVVQHLNLTTNRSKSRIADLSQGREWVNTGGPAVAGQLSEVLDSNFAAVCKVFFDGMEVILGVIDQSDPEAPRDVTASHALYGPFDWLQWAVYSLHVHTNDHIGQVANIKQLIRSR